MPLERPYMGASGDELRAMIERHWNDLDQLSVIAHELSFRSLISDSKKRAVAERISRLETDSSDPEQERQTEGEQTGREHPAANNGQPSIAGQDMESAEALGEAGLPWEVAVLPVAAVLHESRVEPLIEAGISTISDLARVSKEHLSEIPGIGLETAEDIEHFIKKVRIGEYDPRRPRQSGILGEMGLLLPHGIGADYRRDVEVLVRDRGLETGDPETLTEIGEDFGITRERARQLRARLEDAASSRIGWLVLESLESVRRVVRDEWGLVPLPQLSGDIEANIASDGFHLASYLSWLIELLDDSRLQVIDTGTESFVVGAPLGVTNFREGRERVVGLLETDKAVTIDMAAAVLALSWPACPERILLRHALHLLRNCAVQVLPGVYADSDWNRAEWAEFVLEEEGEPLHFTEIARKVNERSSRSYNEAGFNSLLNGSPQFVRVGQGDFALAKWGPEPYGRFDEVISRYLRKRGTAVDEATIVEEVREDYTVSETTVRTMLRSHPEQFIHFGGGYWGLTSVEYAANEELVTLLEKTIGNATEPLRLDAIIQNGPLADFDKGTILRHLYVSGRFDRYGTSSPPRFVLRDDISRQRNKVASRSEDEPTISVARLMKLLGG